MDIIGNIGINIKVLLLFSDLKISLYINEMDVYVCRKK